MGKLSDFVDNKILTPKVERFLFGETAEEAVARKLAAIDAAVERAVERVLVRALADEDEEAQADA